MGSGFSTADQENQHLHINKATLHIHHENRPVLPRYCVNDPYRPHTSESGRPSGNQQQQQEWQQQPQHKVLHWKPGHRLSSSGPWVALPEPSCSITPRATPATTSSLADNCLVHLNVYY